MAVGGEPQSTPKMKNPAGIRNTDGVFHAFTSGKVAALGLKTGGLKLRSAVSKIFLPIPPHAPFIERRKVRSDRSPAFADRALRASSRTRGG
jgi:hypothetical protein